MNTEISKRLKAKAKIEDDKETVKPTVINDVLIRRYIVQYNKENKIFDKNNEPIWHLSHLSLSYKNVIEIDNLKGMDKLIKLQLDNNIICKIQNLDHLVNLEWLDLSFNVIEKIENLDNLSKLTDLSLFSNRLSELSGMEALTNLNVFSFGQNLIRSHEEPVLYLKKCRNKLEVLKMAGNPFAFPGQNEQDYSLYTIEILKNLKYLDYEPIDDHKRKEANNKHGEAAKELENTLAEKKELVDKEVDPELVDAKIECTDDMLEKILKADPEADNLRCLSQFPEDWRAFDEAVNENNVKF